MAVLGRSAPTGSMATSEVAAELALDWLFIHLPSDQMPRQHRTATSTVTVMSGRNNTSGGGGGGDGVNGHDISAPTVDFSVSDSTLQEQQSVIAHLGLFGYTPSECRSALVQCSGDQRAALQDLFAGLTGEREVLGGWWLQCGKEWRTGFLPIYHRRR